MSKKAYDKIAEGLKDALEMARRDHAIRNRIHLGESLSIDEGVLRALLKDAGYDLVRLHQAVSGGIPATVYRGEVTFRLRDSEQ